MITVNPLDYGGRKFVLLIVEDIIKGKGFEEALSRYISQLEKANKELEVFSYSPSIDLKDPRTRIDGFNRFILEDYTHSLDIQGMDYLLRIGTAGRQTSHLLEVLMSLLQATRSEVKREAVDLTALVANMAENLVKASLLRLDEFAITPRLSTNGGKRLHRIALENHKELVEQCV
jgi:light-regulated signal transduction histidine kinase (bacteriophytochrome)